MNHFIYVFEGFLLVSKDTKELEQERTKKIRIKGEMDEFYKADPMFHLSEPQVFSTG